MNYKQAKSILLGYSYSGAERLEALDKAYETGSATLSSGLLVTYDDASGFVFHEERARGE